MASKEALVFTAVVGAVFLAAWHDHAQALPLIKPGPIVVEKMTIEAQWRHRHHQLRRHSRQQQSARASLLRPTAAMTEVS